MRRFQTFNRTILELKQSTTVTAPLVLTAFNRTILELKHMSILGLTLNTSLLIEPFWN